MHDIRQLARQEVDFDALSGGPWDGRTYSYIQREPLSIAPTLRICAERAEIDPVTYQVLRWKFWSINLEHADTIRRMSGSSIIVYMDDFATAILTGRGENLVASPTIQYFTGLADLVVKWTLENRSEDPGIEDGDIFLQNDPYIGTAHQIDTAIYGPVFYEGELVCWIFNSCHVGDIGGIAEGSFCVDAKDIFDEPTPIPPIKIGRKNRMLADVADMFVRQSRTPDMVALQLRSQVAGFVAAKSRMLDIIREYGPATVNGAMQRMIDDCDAVVRKRLLQIPDGEWSERIYIGAVNEEDRSVHRMMTTVRKSGDQLVFDNAGTDPQLRSGNCTYAAWRSTLICSTSSLLAYDQMMCPAGVLRHMQFNPTPGTVNCAIHPGAVTTLTGTLNGIAVLSQALGKMVINGPAELAANAATVGAGVGGFWMLSWLAGNARHAELTADPIAAGFGATGIRDGIDQGGSWFTPANIAGDVEEWEEAMPLIYLYRRDAMDSGGPGLFRGGNGITTCVMAHDCQDAFAVMVGSDYGINNTPGLAGGIAGRSGAFEYLSGTPFAAALANGVFPGDPEGIEAAFGRPEAIHPRSMKPMGEGDLLVADCAGAGGFGDPLKRDPILVANDVAQKLVSRVRAERDYGVVLDAHGNADPLATKARRDQILGERVASAKAPKSASSDHIALDRHIHLCGGSLAVGEGPNGLSWACHDCGSSLGSISKNYKDGCSTLAMLPYELDAARFMDSRAFSDADMEMRFYLCPGCGSLMASEFCRAEDEPLADIRLSPNSVRAISDKRKS